MKTTTNNNTSEKTIKTNKGNNKVKNFFKKPAVVATLIATAMIAVAGGTLYAKQAFDNYNQGLIDQGIQMEKDRVENLKAEVAAMSKTNQ